MIKHIYKYLISCDLGRQNDYTAICLLERVNFNYHLVKIIRYRHSSYERLIQELKHILSDPRIDGPVAVIIDATGVGLAAVDWVRSSGITCFDLTIHGGYKSELKGYHISASKDDLVFSIQNVIEKHRLMVNPDLPYWNETKSEFSTFSPKVNEATGNVTYEALRSRDHDDLVMSLAMAALFGEKLAPSYEIERDEGGFWPEPEPQSPVSEFITMSIDDVTGDYDIPKVPRVEDIRKMIR